MERSDEIADVVVRFYEAINLGTSAAFDSVVSADPEAMVIGTDGRADDRATWKRTFVGLGGVTVERGDIRGYRDGLVGWAVDYPTYVARDGRRLPLRLTAVARQEDGGWKLVQLHISVTVPDDVALAETAAWTAATGA
jgi:ketosteroid isomerase-like protein